MPKTRRLNSSDFFYSLTEEETMSNLIQYIIQDDPEQGMKKKQSQSLLSREGSSQEDIGKNYKFSSRHLLENDFSYLKKQQTTIPKTKKQFNNLLEKIINDTTSNSKRFESNIPNSNHFLAGDIALEGIKGFGQGILSGTESLLNGITLGGYSKFDKKYDLGMQRRRQDIQKAADNVGLGQALKVSNQATEATGAALTGNAILKGVPAVYNTYNIYKGTKNLEKQLRRGDYFQDIFMGRIDKSKLDEINNIRQTVGEQSIRSRKVTIPKDRVEHIYNRRVVEYGYTPEDTAHTISDALFNKNSKVSSTKFNTLQKLESPSANRAVIGKIRNGKHIFVKTGYTK